MRIGILYPWGHLLGERQTGASKRLGLLLDYFTEIGASVTVFAPGGWMDFEKGNVRYVSFRPSAIETRLARVIRVASRLLALILTLGRVGNEDFMLWYHLEWRFQPSLQRRIKELAAWADVILVEYTFWAGPARRYARPGCKLILTTYDVLADQVVRNKLLKRLTVAVERGGLMLADVAVSVSEDDQRAFRRYGVETEVIPHPVDLRADNGAPRLLNGPIAINDARISNLKGSQICLFVGSYFEANLKAVDAIRGIAAAVSERFGEGFCHFVIAGSCAEPREEGNVTALGPVEFAVLESLYRRAALVLIPLPFGTGASVKTVEALAYGKAILGTTVAFRGYPVKDGVHCQVENDLQQYPGAIGQLISDPARCLRLGRNAAAFAQTYDYRRIFSRYRGLMGDLDGPAVIPAATSRFDDQEDRLQSSAGGPITSCRICDGPDLARVIDLGEQPWCNNFLREHELGREARYPLRVVVCQSCAAAQLDFTVPKEVMFADHTYLSGTTRTLTEHFREVAVQVDQRFSAAVADKSVLDIGSNDGTQLLHYRALGYEVLGIDPSKTACTIATSRGIPTLRRFFNLETARDLRKQFDVINAAGVFFHLEELHSVTDGIRESLSSRGVFVVQFLYVKSIIENGAFDQIYHEHLLYYTLATIEVLLQRHGLGMFDAYVSPIHGGSVIGFASHAGAREPTARLKELRQKEVAGVTNETRTYRRFAERIEELKRENLLYLRRAKAAGSRIYGFGAPAKGNTLLNYFGIGPDLIDYLVEKNELRRGLYSPGMHIPIVLERELTAPPDVYYVLAWNFRDEILRNNRHLIDRGVKFHFPVIPQPVPV